MFVRSLACRSLRTAAVSFRPAAARTTLPALSCVQKLETRRWTSSLSTALEAEAAEFQQDEEENVQLALSNLRQQLSDAMDVTETGGAVEIRYSPPAGVGSGDEVITISFHCQDVNEVPNGKSVDDTVGAPVTFNCRVESEATSRSISFDCEGFNDLITVNQVHVYDEDEDPEAAYNGPVFDELAEEVQEGFLDYLDERLVGPEFGTWITKFSYYKEMECYGDWIDKVRSVL